MEHLQESQPGQQSQLPQNDIHACKSKLQQYAQRAGLGLPMYNITVKGEPHAPIFKCSVTVDDETYESPNTFSQKKAAEKDAAKYALECIMEKRQEIGASIISKNTTLCKAILNEFAAKLQIARPIYNTEQIQQVPLPVFISKMEFMGVPYVGGPAKTKKDAEQLLAHHATISILGLSEEDSTLLEIIRSKAHLFSATQVALDPSCAIRPNETIQEESFSDEEQSEDTTKSSLQTENLPNTSVQIPVQSNATPSSPVGLLMYVPSSLSNQSCGGASSPEHQADTPDMLPGLPQNLITVSQDGANTGGGVTPSQSGGLLMYVPSSLSNQSCGGASSPEHQADTSQMLPGLPQNLIIVSQDGANTGDGVTAAAVAANQECCALESRKRMSRNQRKKANKRARMTN